MGWEVDGGGIVRGEDSGELLVLSLDLGRSDLMLWSCRPRLEGQTDKPIRLIGCARPLAS